GGEIAYADVAIEIHGNVLPHAPQDIPAELMSGGRLGRICIPAKKMRDQGAPDGIGARCGEWPPVTQRLQERAAEAGRKLNLTIERNGFPQAGMRPVAVGADNPCDRLARENKM